MTIQMRLFSMIFKHCENFLTSTAFIFCSLNENLVIEIHSSAKNIRSYFEFSMMFCFLSLLL